MRNGKDIRWIGAGWMGKGMAFGGRHIQSIRGTNRTINFVISEQNTETVKPALHISIHLRRTRSYILPNLLFCCSASISTRVGVINGRRIGMGILLRFGFGIGSRSGAVHGVVFVGTTRDSSFRLAVACQSHHSTHIRKSPNDFSRARDVSVRTQDNRSRKPRHVRSSATTGLAPLTCVSGCFALQSPS